jgi:hypothetical protein
MRKFISSFVLLLAACSSSSGSPETLTDGGHESDAHRSSGASSGPSSGASSGPSSGSTSASSTSSPTVPHCGAVGLIPPSLNVWNAKTGAPICDPVVTIVSQSGGGPGGPIPSDGGADLSACGGTTSFAGCPSTPPDGGTLACTFIIFAVNGTATIEVSAPGFSKTEVTGVMSGVTGCVEHPTDGTQVEVELTPLPDAGGSHDAAHPRDA